MQPWHSEEYSPMSPSLSESGSRPFQCGKTYKSLEILIKFVKLNVHLQTFRIYTENFSIQHSGLLKYSAVNSWEGGGQVPSHTFILICMYLVLC